MEYLYIICIGLLVFFSFSLLSRRKKAISEQVFSVWILLLMVTVVSFLFYARGESRQFSTFITLICDSHLLHGAFLYVYVLAFTTSGFKLRPKHFLHLIPMVVQVVYKLYLNYGVEVMQCYEQGGCNEENNIYVSITNMYKYAVLGAYVVATWFKVIDYKLSAKTPREQMRYNWVHQVLLGATFLYFGVLFLQVGRQILPYLFWERMLLGNTLVTLFIFVFLYMGNSYAYLFVSPSKNRFKNLSETANLVGSKQTTSERETDQTFMHLNEYMEKEKAYLRSHLTLKDISEDTHLPVAVISQVVNSVTGSGIADYINAFRVDCLKQKLSDPANKSYKILSLAEECGFSSKSTLLRAFKQNTGITPGEFLNQVED